MDFKLYYYVFQPTKYVKFVCTNDEGVLGTLRLSEQGVYDEQ